MELIELDGLNYEKYVDLLKRVDIGEYKLAADSETYKEFDKWLFGYGIELDNNYGIITAFIYKSNLRMQISFKEDTNEDVVNNLVSLINGAIKSVDCDRLDIWCNNFNTNLVSLLKKKYNFEPNVYMSHEFHYDYKNFLYRDIKPLVAVEYEGKYLDDVLELLEKSFVNIAEKGEFISYKEHYHKKFSSIGQASCEVFLLENQVIGMYSQNNGDLEYIGVLPEFHSYGYGAKILNHALNTMKNIVDRMPFLYCVDSNNKANEFYKREGLIRTGRSAWLQLKLKGN